MAINFKKLIVNLTRILTVKIIKLKLRYNISLNKISKISNYSFSRRNNSLRTLLPLHLN